MGTFCLSLHARYRCQHAGACCRKWAVPVEPQVMAIVNARDIRRAGATGELFVSAASGSEGSWTVARDADGACVFLDRGAGGLCVIHARAGAAALPSACRHFPRTLLRDGRGTFISLSHFCPTAAAMLFSADPLLVVEAQPPLRLPEPTEGMEAAGALPPLVRPGMLSDLEGYAAWERACLATFARIDLDWEQALNLVAAATERVRAWHPAAGPLAEAVTTAFHDARHEDGADAGAQARAVETVRSLCGNRLADDFHPIDGFQDAWDRLVAPSFAPFDIALKNYLAARLFANWIAYQGRGLRSIVEWLRTCAAVVRHHLVQRMRPRRRFVAPGDFMEAVRTSDLLLLHVIDTQALARRFAPAEGPSPR